MSFYSATTAVLHHHLPLHPDGVCSGIVNIIYRIKFDSLESKYFCLYILSSTSFYVEFHRNSN